MTTDDQLRHLVARSVEVIADHQDVGGAYLASPTFPVYRFAWLRDGAFTADAMSRVGERDSADRFFAWCARTIHARTDHIEALLARASAGEPVDRDEHPPTRFTVDGGDSGEAWWDFQLDGYGTWMWALAEHRRRDPDALADAPLDPELAVAVELCGRYLTAFWDRPCFDWWEEHPDDVHTSTLAAVHAGLRAIAAGDLPCADDVTTRAASAVGLIERFLLDRCVDAGHFVKFVGDTRVDASLIALLTPFRTFDEPALTANHLVDRQILDSTYRRIVTDLAPDGVHRYVDDTYFGGGRWIVLAGFVGWHEAEAGEVERARARLEWMHTQATPDGLLPEQVTDHVLDDSSVEVWERKWGPVATPLLWSHAMYLTLAAALGLAPHPQRSSTT